jgi:hypothetical protein
MGKEKIDIDPKKISPAQYQEFIDYCTQLRERLVKQPEMRDEILHLERKALNKVHRGRQFHPETDLVFLKSLLVDLLRQDWELLIIDDKVRLEMEIPDKPDADVEAEKKKTRRRHLLGRDEQLNVDSVLEFIRGMEKKRLTEKGWTSIFSLMRDGGDLALQLRSIQNIDSMENRLEALNSVVKPYIQFVQPSERCSETGLLLTDIWRYFRHTWINEYKSLPGRAISILIRDASVPYHPVIGIAALGSSFAQQTCRDAWIGWEGEALIDRMKKDPSGKFAKWILETYDALLGSIYLKDFFALKIISLSDLRNPTPELIQELRRMAVYHKSRHFDNPETAKFSAGNESLDWEQRAQTNLFKSKRLYLLAELLGIKSTLNKFEFEKGTKRELETCLDSSEFREAVEKLARKVKGTKVGINMMDIIICGAIAPYNHLLGGKLVCMLLTSPEIVRYYDERYGESMSLIASSMKGKPVVRKPHLVVLGTTSLYGYGSSQYNRVKIPCEEIGGEEGKIVEYRELGMSLGYGSFHLSAKTLFLAGVVAGREDGRIRVNSIFGEGANPLMRKVKDAIEYVGLKSGPILNHGNPRVVYGVALAENFGDFLTGLSLRPKYSFPLAKPKEKTALIARYWIKRWLAQRMMNDAILERVSQHTLAYPIVHGARVTAFEDEQQMSLFE